MLSLPNVFLRGETRGQKATQRDLLYFKTEPTQLNM